MSDYLLIGPVLLQDFELPERVLWGGRQRLAVHRLPGGRRVIDAMGRDDADIAWSGAFSGEDAVLRSRAIDLMRADGGVWPLTWGSFFYSVVVSRFDADYSRPNWIPYRIACTVLRDEAAAVVEEGLSLAAGILGDVAEAGGLFDLGAAAGLVALPAALRQGTADQARARTALRGREAALEGEMAARGAALRAAPTGTAAGIRSAEAEAAALAQLAQARGPLARARVGLESLGE